LVLGDPLAMLSFLHSVGKASDRKLRLFAAACSRRCWDLLDLLGRGAVEIAEQYADGLAGAEEMRAARLACRSAGGQAAWYAAATSATVAARNAALSVQQGVAGRSDCPGESLAQATLLRDIFGPLPFRPLPAIDLAWLLWRDGTIPKLAQAIDDERTLPVGTFDPDRLVALGDCLKDAGCLDAEVLGHCHQKEGVHVRGCWLVDALTGRC
jgi:hypothetical protein